MIRLRIFAAAGGVEIEGGDQIGYDQHILGFKELLTSYLALCL